MVGGGFTNFGDYALTENCAYVVGCVGLTMLPIYGRRNVRILVLVEFEGEYLSLYVG